MSRYKTEIEKSLIRIELALQQLEPRVGLSADAIQGIERQLYAALTPRQRRQFLPGHQNLRSSINRLVNMCMALFNGEPAVGQFDELRKAVIIAAKAERQRWDVLAETHHWLSEDRDNEDIRSQLEDRFSENGIEVIWEFEGFSDKRFIFDGQGEEYEVIRPAYVITKGTQPPMIIKNGVVSLNRASQDLYPWPQNDNESSASVNEINDGALEGQNFSLNSKQEKDNERSKLSDQSSEDVALGDQALPSSSNDNNCNGNEGEK